MQELKSRRQSMKSGMFLLLSLALSILACRSETGGSALGALRKVLTPPLEPQDTVPEALEYAPDLQVNLSEMAKLPAGVLWNDLTAGEGPAITEGDSVAISYQGWLPNGTKVDSAETVLRVGAGDVLAGIDAALPGMKPGGRRKLVLSPGLAYGADGSGGGAIPPNAVLVYEVELRAKLR